MKQNLTVEKVQIEDNSVVIKKYIKGIEGGRTLDVTGFSGAIKAGHVIIVNNGTYKPMTVEGDAYGALPENYNYAGILYNTIDSKRPAAAIMTWGVVNSEALPYALTGAKLTAFKAACPYIDFQKDEEA